MTHYTEEQIFIRAMPCPKCGAMPREHCIRKVKDDGTIKNHQERMWLWHDFVKSTKALKRVDLYGMTSFYVKGHEFYDQVVDQDDKFDWS
jgi:hypothetical protein